MSSFNYMDRVPVKIAENYKPPPRLYQLPQAIAHKLALPVQHYHEAPQYNYDFQLERKVLAKIPEWRRMRQQEREARRDRKEKREEERLRAMEARHKQLLGAVSYPSAEELSSSSESEEEEVTTARTVSDMEAAQEPKPVAVPAQTGSFHNILQPTIVMGRTNAAERTSGMLGNSSKAVSVGKDVYAFNYKDFEEDTSSPFDNIELKTINDLDILAQVLHNTQIKEQELKKEQLEKEQLKEKESNDKEVEMREESKEQLETKVNTHKETCGENEKEKDVANNTDAGESTHHIMDTVNLEVLENAKAALQKVDFDNLSLKEWQNESIPNITTTHAISNNYMYHTLTPAPAPGNYGSAYANQVSQQQQQRQAFMPYNQLYNGMMEQQPSQPQPQPQQYVNYNVHANLYNNQNYLYAPNCNGGATTNFYSPTHLPLGGHNTNNSYQGAQGISNGPLQHPQMLATPINKQQSNLMAEASEMCAKSKSVPDILKELSEEVRNSELRRSRYYSYNSDEGKLAEQEEEEDTTPKQSPAKTASKVAAATECEYYNKLEAPVQRLAKNISSMGFPLERVAKIAQMFGADDKKACKTQIIEHLIHLSELLDLGFDESKISEALVKFDNNKEKALEYLIS